MGDVPLGSLLLGATVAFVSGIIVFYVIFYTINMISALEKQTGQKNEWSGIISTMRLIPPLLGIFYFGLVIGIIWYIVKNSKEKEERREYYRWF